MGVDTSRNYLDTSEGELSEKYERGVNQVSHHTSTIIYKKLWNWGHDFWPPTMAFTYCLTAQFVSLDPFDVRGHSKGLTALFVVREAVVSCQAPSGSEQTCRYSAHIVWRNAIIELPMSVNKEFKAHWDYYLRTHARGKVIDSVIWRCSHKNRPMHICLDLFSLFA